MTGTVGKGKIGEDYASEFLLNHGYKIIDRNFHSYFGEIDIVAEKDGYIYFCEVKTRWSTKYGYPQYAVTFKKLLRIRKTVEYYMKVKNIKNPKVKLIVVAQIIINHNPVYQKLIEVD